MDNNNAIPTIVSSKGKAGIYIHYPFCIQKCNYCDFFSLANGRLPNEEEDRIFPAYQKELEVRIAEFPDWLEMEFDTVFLGGGTPSRMNPKGLEALLNSLSKKLSVSSSAEISLEANPEDINKENLKIWKSLGINRINMGYQTSHAKYLSYVGRFYEPDIYKNAPVLLAESEFTHFGYDLIYGFPGQTMTEFLEDIEILTKYNPPHISIYSLTMEKGTEYSRKFREGTMKKPEEDLQADILEILPELLRSKGWAWYEVSNYCKPGFHSRHNLKYWTMEPYLALGPSAHGFTGIKRYSNPRNWESYLKNPSRSHWSDSDEKTELAIGLFRIFYPIEMKSFWTNHPTLDSKKIVKILQKWARLGFAEYDIDTTLFVWKKEAVFQLDELIFEFCQEV